MRDPNGGAVYLKLGGSLITDKRQAETPRPEVLQQLAQEIADAYRARPNLRLIIGHGSGSFGHVVGKRYGTRGGVHDRTGWFGYAATGDAAARLNRLVTAALLAAGLPVWSIQPSVALRCMDGRIVAGPEFAVTRALAVGLTPLVYGDVALDDLRGGTIASTEEIFGWLMGQIAPTRLVLAGEVDGIYTADPLLDTNAVRFPLITPATADAVAGSLGGSHGVDVTGGMAAKVAHALEMVQNSPGLEIVVCSGLMPGHIRAALVGGELDFGTLIRA